MLPHPVTIPSGPHGDPGQHRGWDLTGETPERQAGYAYPVPEVMCHRCQHDEVMRAIGARAVGGRHSLVWTVECTSCQTRIEYPATNFYDDPEPTS